jgi:hypothetical protein
MVSNTYAQSDAPFKPPFRKSSPWSQVPGTRFLECILQRLETLIQLYVKVMVLKLCFNPYLSQKGYRRIQESLCVCVDYLTLGVVVDVLSEHLVDSLIPQRSCHWLLLRWAWLHAYACFLSSWSTSLNQSGRTFTNYSWKRRYLDSIVLESG